MRPRHCKRKECVRGSAREVFTFLLLSVAAASPQYVISTYAGGAPPPTPVAALAESIRAPISVATDVAGSVYFASPDLDCAFELDATGALTRVAGNGNSGYSRDGGRAAGPRL
jgi:hypothetical protein